MDVLAEVETKSKKQEATAKAAGQSSSDSKMPAAALAADDAVLQNAEDQMFQDDEDKAAKKIDYTDHSKPQAEKEINLKEERNKLEDMENQIKAAIRKQWA